MNAFINSLSLLIVTVRRNSFAAVITFLMVLAILLVWSMRNNISNYINPANSGRVQSEQLARQALISDKIYLLLQQELVGVNASRVLIRQFHSIEDEHGGAVPVATVTYIVLAPGVSLSPSWDQPVPQAQLTATMQKVFPVGQTPRCASHSYDEETNPIYKQQLRAYGVKLIYACPILGLNNEPIGMIKASYITTSEPRPSDEEIMGRLMRTGEKVSGYLTAVRPSKQQSLFRRLLSWGS